MKNKHKRTFHQVFKWYDYDFLLQAMELWFSEASKRTESEGVHKAHKCTAKRMKLCYELLRRIRNDDYNDNVVLFPKVEHKWNMESTGLTGSARTAAGWSEDGHVDFDTMFNDPENYYPDKETYQKYLITNLKRAGQQRQRDLDYLAEIMKKYLFSFWD